MKCAADRTLRGAQDAVLIILSRRPSGSRPGGSGGKTVNKSLVAILAALALAFPGFADETVFRTVKLADAKGKQTDAALVFSDENKDVVVRVADRDIATIPYDKIDKFSYEYTKKHRITQGAIVMAASLGVGAIVMLTKSKSHWLYIDFHEQDAPKTIVLRMDKKDYQNIFSAVKTHTGKEVQFLSEGDSKAKKSDDKDKDKGKDKAKDQPNSR